MQVIIADVLAHVLVCDDRSPRALLADIRGMQRARFRIGRVTIQVESETCEEADLHP